MTVEQNIEITGVLVPAAWDADDKVTKIMVATNKENEFLIYNDDKFQEIINNLQKEVKITGKIINNYNGGKKAIKVESYIILKQV